MLELEQKKFLLKLQKETSAQKKIRIDRLIKIFADTQEFCKSAHVLKEGVKFGKQHTTFYKANKYSVLPDISEKIGATLTINLRSFQAAIKFHQEMPEKNRCIKFCFCNSPQRKSIHHKQYYNFRHDNAYIYSEGR